MKRWMQILISGMLCASTWSGPAIAGDSIGDYVGDIPGIGLIMDSIEFDGITISNFTFENGHRYIFVKPKDEFTAHMNYSIDVSDLSTLKLHHFIIGLYDAGPQQCILHSLGIIDSSGDVTVKLKAPEKEGAYQVRFCHTTGLTEAQALQAWWRGDLQSAKTIVGIVVVR